MQKAGIPRLFMVQRLYRRVLKLHRVLPTELRGLGDEYVKDEFRRNKAANQLQAFEFIAEWKVSLVIVFLPFIVNVWLFCFQLLSFVIFIVLFLFCVLNIISLYPSRFCVKLMPVFCTTFCW